MTIVYTYKRKGGEEQRNINMALASSSCVLDPERVITELSRGREIADRLRLMLREADSDSSVLSAQTQSLVTQLLDTFTHSLTMLRPSTPAKSEQDSGDSCKTPPPPPKDRRGCYKRKRNSETVIKESPNMVEDGHAWRKYGQKVILNAKHPRNYFRCTHKYEQGCQASKQVQKVQDNPPLYRTTYNGHHTCTSNTLTSTTNLLYDHHHHTTHNNLISISSPSSPADAVIWSFNTTPTAAAAAVIKHEDIHKSPSPPPQHDDYYMADLTDVYSCSASASASDDNTNYIGDDISIDDFFELGTPLSS